MAELDSELELAVVELAFWLDFAKWWRAKYCSAEEPRILELLELAERRFEKAAHLPPGSLYGDRAH